MIPPPAKKAHDNSAAAVPPETRPIPDIAKAAFEMALANYGRKVNDLALETLAAMGLSQKDGWRVYPAEGVAILEKQT